MSVIQITYLKCKISKKNIPKQWLHFALHSTERLYILPLRKCLAYPLQNSLSLRSSIFLFFVCDNHRVKICAVFRGFLGCASWKAFPWQRAKGMCMEIAGTSPVQEERVKQTDRQTKTEPKSLKPIWLLTQMMELHQTYLTLTEYRICVMMKYECDDMLKRHMIWLWWELQ